MRTSEETLLFVDRCFINHLALPTGASLPAGQAGKRDLGRAKQTETLYFKNYPYF